MILTISQPIHRLGNYPQITLSMDQLNKSQSTTLPSVTPLFRKYLSQKPGSIYQLPPARIKIMKGKFFYDYESQRYGVDPAGWWISEKLDGIRAIWTGHELISRSGKKLHAPLWFIQNFPSNIALDGELYLARGQFNQVQMAVMSQFKNKLLWERLRYQVFDIPDSSKLVFEEVQELLRQELPTHNSKYTDVLSSFHQFVTPFPHILLDESWHHKRLLRYC